MVRPYLSELRLAPEKGVRFHAAQGVGTVTRTGLLLDVGEQRSILCRVK